MSDVAVDGAALYSGPPNHPNDPMHGWQLEIRSSAGRSVQADAYTVHYHYNIVLVGSGEDCLPCRPPSFHCPYSAGQGSPWHHIPTDEVLDLPRSVRG